jgi:putative ABC transport system permease protein
VSLGVGTFGSWGVSLNTLLQDLRYGARTVLRQPGFSLIIALTLALAIGANTVTFSFTNILVLRPLPVHDQDTLAWIFMVDPQRGGDRGPVSIPDLIDYRASLQSFSSIAGTRYGSMTMTGRGDAATVAANNVTANIFETWGLPMFPFSGFGRCRKRSTARCRASGF